MSFSTVLRGAEPTPDGFALRIPETWHQGCTAYGGFSTALALAAAMRVAGDDLPPLRSGAIAFVGPLAGEVNVSARRLRTGRNASWMAAEISGEGGIGLTASFVFMRPGQSSLVLHDSPPPAELIAADQAHPVPQTEHSPAFLRHHFEVRFALPRSPEKRPELCWWVRLREREELVPEREGLAAMTALLLAADALPPGVLPLLSPRARVSSMTWQVNLLSPAPTTRDGWWLLRSTGDYAEQGCSSQRMAIWNADAAPMATGMQSIALFD